MSFRFSGFYIWFCFCAMPICLTTARAQEIRKKTEPLIQASCIDCHDGSSENGLDFSSLQNDLANEATFRKWERIFDRVSTGEMPPQAEARPDQKLVDTALTAIKSSLTAENIRFQNENGRVILRRLTRTEYEYTLNDLLSIHADVGGIIPADNSSSGFDTVFSGQGLSALHVRSYLAAADVAIDAAIQLQRKPETATRRYEYLKHNLVRKHIDEKKEQVTIGELADAIIMFNNASYIYKLDHHLEDNGTYRLRAEAYPYQTKKPVILTINAGSYNRGFTEILGFFDLKPGETRVVEVEAHLTRGQYLFPGVEELDVQADGKSIWNIGPKEFKGAGMALKWMELEGPIIDQWPPQSTTDLLPSVELKELPDVKWDPHRQQHIKYEIMTGENPGKQLEAIVERLAPRAFRRPLEAGESKRFIELGLKTLNDGHSFDAAIRTACRAILASPQFLFMLPQPGKLDDFSLASRLSYFLWKSMPDDELLRLAKEKKLSDPTILNEQIKRMLADDKRNRFVRDFANQWLQLSEIDATSPDVRLYPEFDELLKQSMLKETEYFVGHLIEKNLSVSNLIDSDFAFLNRRLARHYGIEGVDGQEIRRVQLEPDSHRGGILTQASVLKVTANGTTTSPVKRGSWVLTHLLGTPPSPPPATIGSIEPDTRGTTTIRELLDKHRHEKSCAVCHQTIDPPGFALECFDVIGGYRDRFRSQEKGDQAPGTLFGRNIWEYKLGLPVDASGQLTDGKKFTDIHEYQKLLIAEKEQIARNLISQLIVYSTGAEIQFADRDEVERILEVCRECDFGLRTMIEEVIRSKLFLGK